MNTDNEAKPAPPDSAQTPPPRIPKPRFAPSKLPLVQIFRLVQKLTRRGQINLCEALVIHAAAQKLGVMSEFVSSGIKRDCQASDFDELYHAYEVRCALRGECPRSQAQFEQLLLLDPIKVGAVESQVGGHDKPNSAS
jgi:hypothetical protein